jgi:hypothetical protein
MNQQEAKLYSNGFRNMDNGVTYGLMFDDADYFIIIESRRFPASADFSEKGKILVNMLSGILKKDIELRHFDAEINDYTRKDNGERITETTDEQSELARKEILRVVKYLFKLKD